MATAESETPLVGTMRQVALDLIGRRSIRDRDAMIGHLVRSAVDMIPTAAGAGLSRTADRGVRTSHATIQEIGELDHLQSDLGQGPCIDAADDPPSNGVLLARDLEGDDRSRWPQFADQAVRCGFRSILSVSLVGASGAPRSALNLYARPPDAFDDHAVAVAGVFAAHASALLYGADTAAQLGAAVSSRDLIGQAKGILMERFLLDRDEAFEMLVKSSQDTNMKLIEVARWLVVETEQKRRSTTP